MPKTNQSYQKETPANRIPRRQGIVTRILKDGFGYIQSGESGISGEQRSYVFRFDAISDYRGETAKELNLHEGSKVCFDAEGDKVTRLILDEPDQSQSSEKANPSPELKKLTPSPELKKLKEQLYGLLGGADNTELWLNSPHPMLDGRTPQSYVDEGKLGVLEYFIYALEMGQAS